MKNSLRTHISLILNSPKDYFYSFNYSGSKSIRISGYNPDSYNTAGKLIKELEVLCPGMELYLIGSVGLQIEGRGDIDLFATIDKESYQGAFEVLFRKFGKPRKTGRKYNEWEFKYKGYVTELTVTTSQNKRFREQIRLFNLLKNNPVYLEEYRDLKRKLNDHPTREYIRKRMEFFNRILR